MENKVLNNESTLNLAPTDGVKSIFPTAFKAKPFNPQKYQKKHTEIRMKPFAAKEVKLDKLFEQAHICRKEKRSPSSSRYSNENMNPQTGVRTTQKSKFFSMESQRSSMERKFGSVGSS